MYKDIDKYYKWEETGLNCISKELKIKEVYGGILCYWEKESSISNNIH